MAQRGELGARAVRAHSGEWLCRRSRSIMTASAAFATFREGSIPASMPLRKGYL